MDFLANASTPHSHTKILEVRLHTLANPRSNRAIEELLTHLNAVECTYPGTDFKLTYSLGNPESSVNSNSGRDQEF